MKIKSLIFGVALGMSTPLFISCDKAEKPAETPAATQSAEQTTMTKYEDRKDIPEKYKWNLEDLYKTPADWEADYKALESKIPSMIAMKGKITSSAANLKKYLALDKEMSSLAEKLYQYASLSSDRDKRVAENLERLDKVKALFADMGKKTAFIRPEIMGAKKSKVMDFVNSDSELKAYVQYFDDFFRFEPHTLSPKEEKLLAMASPIESQISSTYGMFTSTDIKYPKVKTSEGVEEELTPQGYYSAMYSTDRDYRARAYKGIYEPFMNNINFLASNYLAAIKAKTFRAEARGYESSLEMALDQNNIPVAVYKNLINTVNSNLKPLHRWGEIKKKQLGVKELHPYDTYVTLFEGTEKRYTPEEAMDLCIKSSAPLGEEYVKALKFAFENRWVDFYETKGKRSGAYSTGAAKGIHPYVLMNWGYTLNDVFTLAHEMGHNMHSWFTSLNQDYPYSDYPIFVAEVASITNEILLRNYLIENAKTKEEKLALIETELNNIKGTFYRQTRFAEFEMVVQEKMEAGEALNKARLAEIFGDMYKKYWGDSMVVDEEEANSWPRIHHFYYDFYVYQYATSLCAAEALAAQMVEEGQPAIDRYLNFLKSGKSKYAIETLKVAGVDMSSPKPIEAVIKKADKLLDEMEALLAE